MEWDASWRYKQNKAQTQHTRIHASCSLLLVVRRFTITGHWRSRDRFRHRIRYLLTIRDLYELCAHREELDSLVHNKADIATQVDAKGRYIPDSKVHGANLGPTDPFLPHELCYPGCHPIVWISCQWPFQYWIVFEGRCRFDSYIFPRPSTEPSTLYKQYRRRL